MQVKLDINASNWIHQTELRPLRPVPSATARERDELLLSQSQELLRVLRAESDVRPEKVARGHEALTGSKYPPTEVIDQLSRLLAVETASGSKL